MEIGLWFLMILPLMAAMFIAKVTSGKLSSVLLKGSITWIVLTTAVIGMEMGGGLPMGELIMAAMAVFVLSDVLLDICFIPGMAAFAAGHGMLIWWIVEQDMLTWISIPIGIVLLGVALIAFRKQLKAIGFKMIPFILYAAVLMAMTGMAAVLPVMGGVEYLLFGVGAVLFAVSDLMVARNILVKSTRRWDISAFAMYYIAIFLIALSCWTIF